MVLVKTELGQQVLKDRSVRLTPRQRSVFILCDGKRSAPEVLQASLGQQDDLDALISQGLLAHQATAPASSATLSVSPQGVASGAGAASAAAETQPMPATAGESVVGGRAAQERYQAAYPIAAQLTASLGLRGFRLNLAVEAATNWEELVGLLPKLRAALGADKMLPLERALMP